MSEISKIDINNVEYNLKDEGAIANARYNSSNQKIEFLNSDGDIVAYIDASSFIIDGMVDDVRIEGGYLVIDFNTDSGKQDIEIPLTDIFDPANYYTKVQTDNLLGGKQDTIQDLAAIRSGASAGATSVQPSAMSAALVATVAESGVYDVTANNDGTTFASLSALLSSENLDTLIPVARRKGGMSIKYVCTSDNKYVQCRLMSDTFNTTPTNWQGVDDEPTPESENLTKSDGVFNNLNSLYKKKDITFPNSNTFIIANSGIIGNGSNYSTSNFIDITYIEKLVIKLATTPGTTTLAYYSTNNVSGYISDIGATVMSNIVVIEKSNFPSNAKYIKLCKRDDYSLNGYAYSLSNIYEQYHDELETEISNLLSKALYKTEQLLTDTQVKRVFANLGISAIDTTIYNKLVPTFTSGKFIVKGTGAIENGGTFDVTDFIPIKDVSVVELQVETNGISTSLAYYSTNNVSGYISDIGNTSESTLHIIRTTDFPPEANYIRLCKRNDYAGHAIIYSCPFQKIDNLFYDIVVSNYYASKFINRDNGNVENGSDFSVTDSYLVENIEYIKLFIGTQGGAVPLAFYDKNGNFISAIDNITKSQNFIAYKQAFPSNAYSIRMGKRDSISTGGSITITYRKASGITEWKHRIMAAYGDSVTAICNGDYSNPFKTDFNYGWGQRAARFFDMSAFYGRGIGGQKFCWITNGGSLSWVDKTTGKYAGRDDTHTYEDYINNPSLVPTVSDGGAYNADTCYFVRGAGCSWLRITKMFPESIKNSIDVITIMFHNDADVGDAALNAEPTWVDNSVIDTEWANSSYYSTYGGDYNINTVKGAIASIVMKIQAWMPKVRIVLMTPISGRGTSGQKNKALTDTNMQKLADDVRDMHKLMSIPLVDMYATCGINGLNRTMYITDGIHPYSENGGKAIAGALIGGLKGITPLMNVFG